MTSQQPPLTPAESALLYTELGVPAGFEAIPDRQLIALIERDRFELSRLEYELARRLAAAHDYIDQLLALQAMAPARETSPGEPTATATAHTR